MMVYFALVVLVTAFFLLIRRLDREVTEDENTYELCAMISLALWGGAVILVIWHGVGSAFVARGGARAEFGGLLMLLWSLAAFVYAIAFVLNTLSYGAGRVKAIIMLTHRHPATHAVERSVHKHPTNLAQELAQTMRSQEVDDIRAIEIINKMSPWERFVAKARYEKRIKEAKRLREMVEAQTRANAEENALARRALQMERDKRGRL